MATTVAAIAQEGARPDTAPPRAAPRLGFLGVGWIGAHRLRAVAASGAGEVVGVADASVTAARQALAAIAPHTTRARYAQSLESMLDAGVDGIVIATPSGQHAEQALHALAHGTAVFCQKPLARTQAETSRVIAAARERDRLLRVDFCYREVAGVAELARLVREGALGEVFSVELMFHNAYGPDKPWFYDVAQSGGGCVIDLGIHLVDIALWALGFPAVEAVRSRLYAQGKRLHAGAQGLEDHALAEIDLAGGTSVRLACSWRSSQGCDAVIDATFTGSLGAVRLRNVGGSFYDFKVEHYEGTRRRVLAEPPDDWGGRAICAWAERLARDPGFEAQSERLADVAAVIDAIYGR